MPTAAYKMMRDNLDYRVDQEGGSGEAGTCHEEPISFEDYKNLRSYVFDESIRTRGRVLAQNAADSRRVKKTGASTRKSSTSPARGQRKTSVAATASVSPTPAKNKFKRALSSSPLEKDCVKISRRAAADKTARR